MGFLQRIFASIFVPSALRYEHDLATLQAKYDQALEANSRLTSENERLVSRNEALQDSRVTDLKRVADFETMFARRTPIFGELTAINDAAPIDPKLQTRPTKRGMQRSLQEALAAEAAKSIIDDPEAAEFYGFKTSNGAQAAVQSSA